MNTAIKNKPHYYSQSQSHPHQQIKQHIPVNLPIKFRKKLLYNVFDKVWPWVLTLIMFFGLAVLGLRCF